MFFNSTAMAKAFIGAKLVMKAISDQPLELERLDADTLSVLKLTFDLLGEKELRGSPVYKRVAILMNDEINRRNNLAPSSTGG